MALLNFRETAMREMTAPIRKSACDPFIYFFAILQARLPATAAC